MFRLLNLVMFITTFLANANFMSANKIPSNDLKNPLIKIKKASVNSSTYKLFYSIYPNCSNPDIHYKIEKVDSSSPNASSYYSCVVDQIEKSCTITCLQPSDYQYRLVLFDRKNSSVSCSVLLDYEQKLLYYPYINVNNSTLYFNKGNSIYSKGTIKYNVTNESFTFNSSFINFMKSKLVKSYSDMEVSNVTYSSYFTYSSWMLFDQMTLSSFLSKFSCTYTVSGYDSDDEYFSYQDSSSLSINDIKNNKSTYYPFYNGMIIGTYNWTYNSKNFYENIVIDCTDKI